MRAFENRLLNYLRTEHIRLKKVTYFLKRCAKIHPHKFDNVLCTALCHAISNPKVNNKVIEELLRYGANLSAQNSRNVTSKALLHAARNSNINYAIIEMLLKNGADVNNQNYEDGHCTALLYAARNPKVSNEVIELLLKNGADVHALNYEDGHCTALIYAARNPSVSNKLIELLLKNGANVNASNYEDGHCTALLYAARQPNINYDVIEMLLRNGADVNLKNLVDGGCTALHYAVKRTNIVYKVIKCLLERGANVYATNAKDSNCTALVYAVRKWVIDPAVVELLLHHAAENYKRRTTVNALACFKMLKYIVLDRVKQNPMCIIDFYTSWSVLGDQYFHIFSRHFDKDVLWCYIEKYVLEITQMKAEGIFPLFLPSPSLEESSVVEPGVLVQRLLTIWSDNRYPLYSNVIQSDLENKDVLNVLPMFQLYTRSNEQGVEKVTSLGCDPTLSVIQYISLKDMLRLLEAFHPPIENIPTAEQCFSPRKKQKLC